MGSIIVVKGILVVRKIVVVNIVRNFNCVSWHYATKGEREEPDRNACEPLQAVFNQFVPFFQFKFRDESPSVKEEVEWLHICNIFKELSDHGVAETMRISSYTYVSIYLLVEEANLNSCETSPDSGRDELSCKQGK